MFDYAAKEMGKQGQDLLHEGSELVRDRKTFHQLWREHVETQQDTSQ